MRQIRISTEKVIKRGENIENIQIGEMEDDATEQDGHIHQLPPQGREAGWRTAREFDLPRIREDFRPSPNSKLRP